MGGSSSSERRAVDSHTPILQSDVTFDDRNPLGSGSFGVVRQGSWLGTCVAIKTLTSDAAEVDPSLLQNFERELRLLAELRHPNIISLFGYFRSAGRHLHLVMELGECCLSSRLLSCGAAQSPLAMDISLKIALDVACGLLFLHEGLKNPVVHCDLKSANVILCHGTAKLADFGVARRLQRASWLGGVGAGCDGVLGSVQWCLFFFFYT